MFGFTATDAPDVRRWLDHGRWPLRHPLADEAAAHDGAADAYAFLEAKGPGLHQIPVGPVHAGIIEPGHFRFHASGEAVVRLEERLGYKHKGIDALMRGASLERVTRSGGALSGNSTVAYSIAFARAVEAALGVDAPPRAQTVRGVMAELERLANHFGDIGAICNDAAFALMHAHCGVLRERTLRAAEDRVRPSADDGRSRPRRLLRRSRARRSRGDPRARPRRPARPFPSSSSFTTTPLRCRTALWAPAC